MNAIIFSISSDIGYSIAIDWLKRGYKVIGTYRNKTKNVQNLKNLGVKLYKCKIDNYTSVENVSKKIGKLLKWDILMPCAATQNPVGLFKDNNFKEWKNSINLNLIAQAQIIHCMLDYRNKNSTVINWAGGGVNNAVDRYSAYTTSKIALIKLTELLDSEIKDVKFIILGPGWVKTKIHNETLRSRKKSGKNFHKTKMMLKSNKCNDIKNVIECVNILTKKSKNKVGGRNISVVFDKWKSNNLYKKLSNDKNVYKLRRYKNNI